MKINLPDGNALLIIGGGVYHSDFSGKINFRKEIRNFLKERGRKVITKSVELPHKTPFYVLTEKAMRYLDILEFACWLARR